MSVTLLSSNLFAMTVLLTTSVSLVSSSTSQPGSFQRIPFQSCGGQVLDVRAFGCGNDSLPCMMTRGSKGRVEVDFITPFDARSLYADVRGRTPGTSLYPIYIPLSRFDKDACVGHGITCPVKKDSKLTYWYEMKVDESMQPIQTDAIWRLTDYWGFTIACFKVDINISK